MKTIQTGEWDGVPIVRAETTEDRMEEILKDFPRATINNSKSIARKALNRLVKSPSEANAQKVESLIEGVSVDFHEVLEDREPNQD